MADRSWLLLGPDSDVNGADLSGLDLSGIDLGRATIGQSNVAGTKLATTNLVGAQVFMLTGVPASLPPGSKILNGAWLGPGANLIDASLMGMNLSGIDFSHTDLPRRRPDRRHGQSDRWVHRGVRDDDLPGRHQGHVAGDLRGHGFAS